MLARGTSGPHSLAWQPAQARNLCCGILSLKRSAGIQPICKGQSQHSTSVIREEPQLQQMLTRPLCCGAPEPVAPQMIMEMGSRTDKSDCTWTLARMFCRLRAGSPGSPEEDADFPASSSQIPAFPLCSSSLTFKSWRAREPTLVPCSSVGWGRGLTASINWPLVVPYSTNVDIGTIHTNYPQKCHRPLLPFQIWVLTAHTWCHRTMELEKAGTGGKERNWTTGVLGNLPNSILEAGTIVLY